MGSRCRETTRTKRREKREERRKTREEITKRPPEIPKVIDSRVFGPLSRLESLHFYNAKRLGAS